MLKEFREFIARGNVLDLAVGIIIGAAFTSIVNSLVNDMINPIISILTGGYDFSSLGFRLGDSPDAAVFAYGKFIMALINFFIIAWAVFLLVKAVNKAQQMANFRKKEEEAADSAAPAAPTEAELLIEIRDELRRRPA